MKVELLADHADVILTLSEWYRSEWEPYYGLDGPGDAQTDLQSRCNRDEIPIGLVAMQGAQVLGTIALDIDPATNLTPSVVGLLVRRNQRGKGVATALLESVECLARRLNYERLYISTTVLDELLKRRGWQSIGEVTFLNHAQGSIYIRDL